MYSVWPCKSIRRSTLAGLGCHCGVDSLLSVLVWLAQILLHKSKTLIFYFLNICTCQALDAGQTYLILQAGLARLARLADAVDTEGDCGSRWYPSGTKMHMGLVGV